MFGPDFVWGTQWTTDVSEPLEAAWYMPKSIPHEALKSSSVTVS